MKRFDFSYSRGGPNVQLLKRKEGNLGGLIKQPKESVLPFKIMRGGTLLLSENLDKYMPGVIKLCIGGSVTIVQRWKGVYHNVHKIFSQEDTL